MKILAISNKYPRSKNDTSVVFLRTLYEEIAMDKSLAIEIIAADDEHIDDSYIDHENLSIKRFKYWFKKHQSLAYGDAILSNLHHSSFKYLLIVPFILSLTVKIISRIITFKPDIIHCHWAIPCGFLVSPIAYTCKIPWVLTLHGGDIYGIKSSLGQMLNKIAISSATKVIAVSHFLNATLVERYKINADIVLPMGVDTSLFSPLKDAKSLLGLSEKKVLLFVGRLSEKKGILVLLNALKVCLQRLSENTVLLIIGSGNLEEKLKSFVLQNQLDQFVQFIGNIPNQELPLYYSAANVVVIPSIFSIGGQEGLPVTLLEAWACKRPILATNVGGMADLANYPHIRIIESNNHKLLADAIISSLDASKFRSDHVPPCPFTIKTIGQSHLAIYQDLLLDNTST